MNDIPKFTSASNDLKNPKSPQLPAEITSTYNLCIDKWTLGDGDEKLGRILMKAFFKTLPELENLPVNIIFLNQGVFLTATDSPELATLKMLEKAGCKLLVCGTCIDFYNLKEQLAVGQISNMFVIATLLTGPDKVVRI